MAETSEAHGHSISTDSTFADSSPSLQQFDPHNLNRSRRRRALPLATTLVDVGAAAYAIYQIAQTAEYTLDKLKALYDYLTFKYDDYVESVDPTKGYSPARVIDSISQTPWVRVEIFNSFLNVLDTSDVFDLEVRKQSLSTLNSISNGLCAPFSRHERFPPGSCYVCLYGPKISAEMFFIRDALTSRMYNGLEKDVEEKIRRLHLAVATIKKYLMEPLDLKNPVVFTTDVFEAYFSLSYES
jgi:hypothetical protein